MNGDMLAADAAPSTQAGTVQSQANAAAVSLPLRVCSKCKKIPARPGQWYCRGCHNSEMRRYRLHHRGEVSRLKWLLDNLTTKNADTLRKFEKKIGKTRRVIVLASDGSRICCSGEAVEFRPGNVVGVITSRGQVIQASLDSVERDRDRVPIEPEIDNEIALDSHPGLGKRHRH